MMGCLRTHVRKQPIIALYFESETVVKVYNLKARTIKMSILISIQNCLILIHNEKNQKTTKTKTSKITQHAKS